MPYSLSVCVHSLEMARCTNTFDGSRPGRLAVQRRAYDAHANRTRLTDVCTSEPFTPGAHCFAGARHCDTCDTSTVRQTPQQSIAYNDHISLGGGSSANGTAVLPEFGECTFHFTLELTSFEDIYIVYRQTGLVRSKERVFGVIRLKDYSVSSADGVCNLFEMRLQRLVAKCQRESTPSGGGGDMMHNIDFSQRNVLGVERIAFLRYTVQSRYIAPASLESIGISGFVVRRDSDGSCSSDSGGESDGDDGGEYTLCRRPIVHILSSDSDDAVDNFGDSAGAGAWSTQSGGWRKGSVDDVGIAVASVTIDRRTVLYRRVMARLMDAHAKELADNGIFSHSDGDKCVTYVALTPKGFEDDGGEEEEEKEVDGTTEAGGTNADAASMDSGSVSYCSSSVADGSSDDVGAALAARTMRDAAAARPRARSYSLSSTSSMLSSTASSVSTLSEQSGGACAQSIPSTSPSWRTGHVRRGSAPTAVLRQVNVASQPPVPPPLPLLSATGLSFVQSVGSTAAETAPSPPAMPPASARCYRFEEKAAAPPVAGRLDKTAARLDALVRSSSNAEVRELALDLLDIARDTQLVAVRGGAVPMAPPLPVVSASGYSLCRPVAAKDCFEGFTFKKSPGGSQQRVSDTVAFPSTATPAAAAATSTVTALTAATGTVTTTSTTTTAAAAARAARATKKRSQKRRTIRPGRGLFKRSKGTFALSHEEAVAAGIDMARRIVCRLAWSVPQARNASAIALDDDDTSAHVTGAACYLDVGEPAVRCGVSIRQASSIDCVTACDGTATPAALDACGDWHLFGLWWLMEQNVKQALLEMSAQCARAVDDVCAYVESTVARLDADVVSLLCLQDTIGLDEHCVARAALRACGHDLATALVMLQSPEQLNELRAQCGARLERDRSLLALLFRRLATCNPQLAAFKAMARTIKESYSRCVVCSKEHHMRLLKPTICDGALCAYQLTTLHMGACVEVELMEEPEVCDYLISTTCAAACGPHFSPQPNLQQAGADGTMRTLGAQEVYLLAVKMPEVAAMKRWAEERQLRARLDAVDALLYPLLLWILTTNRAHIHCLRGDERIPELHVRHQFVIRATPPEKERVFRKARARYGSFYTFHGSGTQNWHSIVRNGLRNYSGTQHQTSGAAYGPGIYMGKDYSTSSSYTHRGSGMAEWPNSTVRNMSCMAVCEVVNVSNRMLCHGGVHKPHCRHKPSSPYFRVTNEDMQVTRFLLVIENSSGHGPAAKRLTIPKQWC